MKRFMKDYFTFSKKERLAVIFLLLMIGCFISIPYFYSLKPSPPVINTALAKLIRDQNIQTDTVEKVFQKTSTPENLYVKKAIPFNFDPNIASENDWKRLGINNKTIHTLVNYRNKGGKFRHAEDLLKIWGFRKEDADRLIPFVQINQPELSTLSQKMELIKWNQEIKNRIKIQPKEVLPIDINTATHEDWKSLPGIGDFLADRIIKFRDRMGGFTEIVQVQKTYGISDSVFGLIKQYLIINTKTIIRLNVNTASAYDIKLRTNMPDVVAKAIVVYRQQYGPFHTLDDLKKVVILSDSLYQKLIIHVSIE